MNDSPTKNISVNNDIIDIDLSVTKKKKFRFDGDNTRIIELNTSDLTIVGRVGETMPKLEELQVTASKLMEGIDIKDEDTSAVAEGLVTISERLKSIDTEMRKYIDYIFNAEVSSKAAPDGSMYDVFNGTFRYDYIMSLLFTQYEENLQKEFSKMEKRAKLHTDKYTKK